MKVELAGFNIDRLLLKPLFLGNGAVAGNAITPETISASYARISRSRKSIEDIRKRAIGEVEKARQSNRRIIFEMGHASVAEHAVFNFDVEGISRLAVEYIESFRLASFTEKSQRYVIFDEEYHVPESIKGKKLEAEYRGTVHKLAGIYRELFEKLKEEGGEEESAKEDSRYATPLATLTQFGMTLNARNLEYMIVRLKNSPIRELRDFSSRLYESIKDITPSLVKYVDADPYYEDFFPSNEGRTEERNDACDRGKTEPEVFLEEWTDGGEEKIAGALLFAEGKAGNLDSDMAEDESVRRKLFGRIFNEMKAFHPLPRAFEMAGCTFLIECSASAFAQLKRHRMATLIPGPYERKMGFTVPPSIAKVGLTHLLKEAVGISGNLYEKIYREEPDSAPYILTNSHRRRLIFKADLRELYHIARLRSDHHAQWEIRMIADRMVELTREKFPLAMAMACGKDAFDEYRKKFLSSW